MCLARRHGQLMRSIAAAGGECEGQGSMQTVNNINKVHRLLRHACSLNPDPVGLSEAWKCADIDAAKVADTVREVVQHYKGEQEDMATAAMLCPFDFANFVMLERLNPNQRAVWWSIMRACGAFLVSGRHGFGFQRLIYIAKGPPTCPASLAQMP